MKTKFLIPLAALLATGCSQAENGETTQAAAQPAPVSAGADHVDAPGAPGAPGAPAHTHGEEQSGMDMAMMTPAPEDTPATRSYKASMAMMMKTMPAYTQDADVDFNRQMKVHHQAAIDMAEAELTNGKDAASKALAQEIMGAQRKEIAQIDAWLQQRGR